MACLLDKIVGHKKVIEHFKTQISHGRLHHSFLMVGPSGIGKRTTALAIAQSLSCTQSKNNIACGLCSSCLRIENALVKNLPGTESLLMIAPEKAQIKIEQAQEVRSFLHLQSISKARVIVIDGADKLNSHAANSLLKLIEEPPADTYFFLIAPTPAHVLPTIRSRSQIVTFQPLEIADLKRKQPSAPEWAYRLCQGSLEILSELTDKTFAETRALSISWIEDWANSEQAYLFEGYRDFIKDRGQAKALVHQLIGFMRDLIYLHMGEEEAVLNQDLIGRLKPLLAKAKQEQIMLATNKLLHLEASVDANLDVQLLFEKFWIETSPTIKENALGWVHVY